MGKNIEQVLIRAVSRKEMLIAGTLIIFALVIGLLTARKKGVTLSSIIQKIRNLFRRGNSEPPASLP